MTNKTKPSTFSPNIWQLLKIAWRTRVLKKHESWSREQIIQHQQNELKRLRTFVYKNSPFYQKFHKGLENQPLDGLPILTKKELMSSWDDVVTDKSLRLKDAQKFLENENGLETYLNRYFVFATGGSTGVKGITVFSKDEFLGFFSLTGRASSWTSLHFPFGERPRMSTVQSHLPWHVAGAAAFIKLPIVKLLALDTIEPLDQLVRKLNAFQPHVLGGYASNVHLLAQEQIAGRLNVKPNLILSTAETLKKEARIDIKEAWGITPFEAYGSTETAEVASECQEHQGLHIFEDVAIVEVVDNNNQPVPPGTYGSKVLVTVLWNRTMPLIRYEVSDHVMLSERECPCGRPFRLIKEVQGREEQVIYLTRQSGNKVRVEPDLFFDNMVLLPIDGWQIVQKKDNALTFLILGAHQEFIEQDFTKNISAELIKLGANSPEIKVEYITELRRTKVGKVITIQALKK